MKQSWLKFLVIAIFACSVLALQTVQFLDQAAASHIAALDDAQDSEDDHGDRDVSDGGALLPANAFSEAAPVELPARYFSSPSIFPSRFPPRFLRPPILIS